MNKFSVLMSVFRDDNPSHFFEALQSINKQTIQPDELVLVIDGEVSIKIKKVLDNYIKNVFFDVNILQLEKNIGLALALRAGLVRCRNNLVARMDSDDISLEHRFEKQLLEFNKNPYLKVVGGNIIEFNDLNSDTSIRNVPLYSSDIVNSLPLRSPFNHVSVMYKKDFITQIGSYKNFRGIEDLALWFDVVNSSQEIMNIDDILVRVRVNPDFVFRRSGIAYAKQEARVYKYAWKKKYISYSKMVMIISIRIPIRLLPKRFISLAYRFKRYFE